MGGKLLSEYQSNPRLISTQLKPADTPLKTVRDSFIVSKIRSIVTRKHFDLQVTLFLALFVLVMRGTSGEGQASFLGQFLKGYIEETSASVAGFVRLPNANTYYINNLANAETHSLGQGGEATNTIEGQDLAVVQQSAVMGSTPVLQDYTQLIGKRTQMVEYAVQEGDLLSFIASDYGVSVESIMWANGLKNADNINPGQILKIPPVTGVVYVVKKGDTVLSIAKQFQGEASKIIEFNSLAQEGALQIGTQLIIPDGKMRAAQTAYAGQPRALIENGGRFANLPNLVNYFILPTTGFNWGIPHGRNGSDIANSCGTPIYAAAEGSVALSAQSGYNGGFGKFVKLIHSNGTETIYAHLSKNNVAIGATVTQGQIIGLMGTTGRSTGCHLHFEVHGAKNPFLK